MSAAFPELAVSRPRAATFEEHLRQALRDAPYLLAALLVHALVLLVLLARQAPLPVADPDRVIRAAPADLPLLPPPELLPPPQRDDVQPVLDDPRPTDVPDDPPAERAPELSPTLARSDAGLASELGTGGGSPDLGRPGGGGPPGGSGGAPRRTEAAVHRALAWLAAHQSSDGHWSAAEFDAECGRLGSDVACDGRGSPVFDTGVTALALLPFLGAGHTERHGEFAGTVRAGLRHLVAIQDEDGGLGLHAGPQATYDHALATLALCEGYLRGRSGLLRRPAQRAVDRLLQLRTPGAGWRYLPEHPEMLDPARRSDTSVTGWAVLALVTARKAGLTVDGEALDDALLFLDALTDPVTGRTGYVARGEPVARERGSEQLWPPRQSEALTAVAILCRALAAPDALDDPDTAQLVARGAALVAALPPTWDPATPGRRDFYFWYAGAYALYQAGEREQWRAWERAILDVVLAQQHASGERTGSWDPQHDPWGHLGGRVYSTAILTLLLEVYYRYPSLPGEGR